MTLTAETPQPPATTRRSLAPDLARGFMLLAVALAHAPGFLPARDTATPLLDNIAEFISTILVTDQARPMFVFLFGYALTQLAISRQRRGADDLSIRKLLRRRGFWLIAIGFAHATLLIPLDILGPYGVATVLFAGMVNARTKTLLWTAGAVFVPAMAMSMMPIMWGLYTGTTAYGPFEMDFSSDLFAKALLGVQSWAFGSVGSLFIVVPGMLLGILAARHRLLDEPHRHLRLLRRLGWGGLAIAVAGKLPAALILTDVWNAAMPLRIAAGAIYPFAGYLGGIALAALVGVLAVRLDEERGRFTLAVSALGQRSMTFYLFQSVVFLVMFYPFTLDLSRMGGFAVAAAVALGIWLVSLLLADAMRRLGKRGPAETLLRRLTRGRETAPA